MLLGRPETMCRSKLTPVHVMARIATLHHSLTPVLVMDSIATYRHLVLNLISNHPTFHPSRHILVPNLIFSRPTFLNSLDNLVLGTSADHLL